MKITYGEIKHIEESLTYCRDKLAEAHLRTKDVKLEIQDAHNAVLSAIKVFNGIIKQGAFHV